ncbi:hypothetical protein ABK040_000757 [Willaertia magna]
MVIDLIERNPRIEVDILVHSYKKLTSQNRRNNNVKTITCVMTCLNTLKSSTTEERFRELLISSLKLRIEVNEHKNKLLNTEEQTEFIDVTVPFICYFLFKSLDICAVVVLELLRKTY